MPRRWLSLIGAAALSVAAPALGLEGVVGGKVVAGFSSALCTAESGAKGQICIDTDAYICQTATCAGAGWIPMTLLGWYDGDTFIVNSRGVKFNGSQFVVGSDSGFVTISLAPMFGGDGLVGLADVEDGVFALLTTTQSWTGLNSWNGGAIVPRSTITGDTRVANAGYFLRSTRLDGSWSGATMSVLNSGANYFAAGGPWATVTSSSDVRSRLRYACTVTSGEVSVSPAYSVAGTLTVALWKNGSSTGALSCNPPTGTASVCTFSGSLSFSAGDDYEWRASCTSCAATKAYITARATCVANDDY